MNAMRVGWCVKIPLVVLQVCRIIGYFLLGAMACLLTTEVAKCNIGRLRPYFFTACYGDEFTLYWKNHCSDSHSMSNAAGNTGKDFKFHPFEFVTNYECTQDSHHVAEAQKSFLSGHSSFSFYTATFLLIYLHARLYNDRNGTIKHFQDTSNNKANRNLYIYRSGSQIHPPIYFIRLIDQGHSQYFFKAIIQGFCCASDL